MVGILLGNVKEQNINACGDMDGSQKYRANWFPPAWKTDTVVTPLADLSVWAGAHTRVYTRGVGLRHGKRALPTSDPLCLPFLCLDRASPR